MHQPLATTAGQPSTEVHKDSYGKPMRSNVLYQRDWDARLPLFFLAYKSPNHETAGITPASSVLTNALCLTPGLLFRAPADKE
jgi:hypothetical protein